ncbi:hypothetical protein AAHE18_20G199500 [Arachis hypogaea]
MQCRDQRLITKDQRLRPARHSPHHRIQSSAPLTTAKKHVHGPSKIEHSSRLLVARRFRSPSFLLVAPSLQVQGPAVQLIRGGGINRVKNHLAGKGGDIEAYRKVLAVVRHQFNQNIEDLRTKKRKTQEEYAESYGACDDVEREFDEIEPTPGAQPSIKSVLQSKEIVEKCDITIARWMMDASLPFNVVNSAYYQPMINAIANMGAGYKGPNYQRVRGYLLSKLVEDVKKMIEGTVFLKSVDASHISKTAEALFKLLRDVVLFVGSENVVHVVTNNAANYVAAGREWTSSAYSKEAKAKKFVDQVLDSKFWNQCTDIIKLTKPLVHVLRIVDSEDRAAMGFLYQTMYKAREDMVKRFQKRKRVVEPYLKILDSRWDSQLKRNLHAAGYWLNPAFRFNSAEFDKHKEIISGLLDVIERYAYGDADLNTKLTSEKRIFKNAEGDFGRQSAIRERSTVMPDELNLEDDRDDGEANNTSAENTNQNETNQDVAPDYLSDEERYPDFEVTPWI